MNVIINGDKTQFISKNAICRLKKDLKENMKIEKNDYIKYLNKDYTFTFEYNTSNITVNIIDQVKFDEENKKKDEEKKREERRIEIRRQLKSQMKDNNKERSGENKRKLLSLKKTLPENIFNSYTNLTRKYKLANLPAPDDVINNVDKYKMQISTVMGLGENMSRLSNDPNVSNGIKKYFTELGTYLKIEPMVIDIDRLKLQETFAQESMMQNKMSNISNNDVDTEDDDD
jgi:hypothetical protein